MEIAKSKYKKLVAQSPVNKALDYGFVDKTIGQLVSKHYPDFAKITELKHEEHKRRVGKKHSAFIYSYYISGATDDNQPMTKRLIFSSHTDNSRKIAYDNLNLIDKAGFNTGPYQAIKPLDYIEEIHALIYEAVEGNNLYQYMQRKAPIEDLSKIIEQTSNWVSKFHATKLEKKVLERLSLFDYHDFNPHSSQLLEAVTKTDAFQGNKLQALLDAMDKLFKQDHLSQHADLVYGDLHPENVILRNPNQDNLTMIDFTDLSRGDQLRDIGSFIQQLHFMGRDYYPAEEIEKLRLHFIERYSQQSLTQIPLEKFLRINFYQAWNSLRGFTWLFFTSKARGASYGLLEDAWRYLTLAIEKKKEITISY